MTKKRIRNLKFKLAFLDRRTEEYYYQFRELYPKSSLNSILDEIYNNKIDYLIINTSNRNYLNPNKFEIKLKKLDKEQADVNNNESFSINTNKPKVKALNFPDLHLDETDLRPGYTVRLDMRYEEIPKIHRNLESWLVIDYVQPKRILIKGIKKTFYVSLYGDKKLYIESDYGNFHESIIIDKNDSKIEYLDRYLNVHNYDRNKSLPLEYKIVSSDESREDVWGELSYTLDKRFSETDWIYRSYTIHFNLKNIQFKNIDKKKTSWDNLKNSYVKISPNNKTKDVEDYIITGSYTKLPMFEVLD